MQKKKAIIIGSGAAGAILAKTLLENDVFEKVLMLEAGKEFKLQDERLWLDFVMADREPYAGGLDEQDFPKPLKGFDPEVERTPFLFQSRLMIEGGATNHWGGWSLRMKPEDFKLKTNLEHAGKFKEARYCLNWQLDYKDLKDFYDLQSSISRI